MLHALDTWKTILIKINSIVNISSAFIPCSNFHEGYIWCMICSPRRHNTPSNNRIVKHTTTTEKYTIQLFISILLLASKIFDIPLLVGFL